MKNFFKYFLSLSVIFIATLLLSWNELSEKNANKDSITQWQFEHNFFHRLSDADITAFNAEASWDDLDTLNRVPPAEDVLVQRIPGDNSHLLMLAYYSRENYTGPTVSVNIGGSDLVFRDDGKDYDKVAGDGFYTTRIAVDVNAFRQEAINMSKEMKASGEVPVRFIQRAMVVDPDKTNDFDAQALDNSQAVSISGLEASTATTTSKLLDKIQTHSIFITATSVVEDPTRTWNPCAQTGTVNGPWTFKTLMKQLASKDPAHLADDATVSTFVKDWLNNWTKNKSINGDNVPKRTLVNDKILNPWLNKSLQHGSPSGQLDMRFAPFKLLAIVNRFDLRERFAGIPAGEGRFIFCLIDTTCTKAENFTVIFEYHIPKPNVCDSIKAWAQQWFDLKQFDVGTPDYNKALQAITDQFTKCGTDPNGINQSCLNTVRTNDRALSPSPIQCEFRQFQLSSKTNELKQTTMSDAPMDLYNAQVDNPAVERWVTWTNENKRAIIDNHLAVPKTFQDSPLLGGKSTILGPTVGDPKKVKVYHWDGTEPKGTAAFIKSGQARQLNSLNACSGCHSGETQTNFTHVDPVFFGKEATLSGFLTGNPGQGNPFDFDGKPTNDSMMVEDPALRPQSDPLVRMFNDILRRAKDLKEMVNSTCGSPLQVRDALMFQPVNSVD